MARLVAVCREGEEDYPFLSRQIPLHIDDTLTMVMEFSDSVMDVDSNDINVSHWKQFSEVGSFMHVIVSMFFKYISSAHRCEVCLHLIGQQSLNINLTFVFSITPS
uniref:Gametogenetin-binding protein 2 n=1 Tax=Labrus bergylta TaxID=56723 RepID=A0A3Q3EJW0_9LABR